MMTDNPALNEHLYGSDGVQRVRHTPGPWITNRLGTQVLTGDSWSTVCEIYISKDHRFASWEDGRAATEPDANARLIAAAPDLLDALKDARYALYGNGPGNPKIDAAIAKAERKP